MRPSNPKPRCSLDELLYMPDRDNPQIQLYNDCMALVARPCRKIMCVCARQWESNLWRAHMTRHIAHPDMYRTHVTSALPCPHGPRYPHPPVGYGAYTSVPVLCALGTSHVSAQATYAKNVWNHEGEIYIYSNIIIHVGSL